MSVQKLALPCVSGREASWGRGIDVPGGYSLLFCHVIFFADITADGPCSKFCRCKKGRPLLFDAAADHAGAAAL